MRKFILFIYIICTQQLFAQLPNELLYDRATDAMIQPKRVQENDSLSPLHKQAYFSIQALSFMRNNEYFSSIYPGHTYFGYQLQPELIWQPTSRYLPVVRMGMFMQYHYGEQRFETLRPVFSLMYKTKANEFIFGTLKGAWEHGLIEPLYGFERGLEQRVEEGFQLKHKSKRAKVDFWVNWMQTTALGEEQPEKIMAGLVGNYDLVQKENWYFQLDFQGLTYHEGGAEVQSPIVNRTNGALGGEIGLKHKGKRSAFLQSYMLYSSDHSLVLQQPYSKGWAQYSHLGLQKGAWLGMLGYWHGTQYFSNLGSPVFQSFAAHNNYLITRQNKLLFIRMLYTMPIKHPSFESGIRFEPIYSIDNQSLDYSFGFYVKLQLGV